jgi:chaperonin GroES
MNIRQQREINIRPLHDRIVVQRIEPEEEVRGGIIIPDTAKEKSDQAEVIAVGPGRLLEHGIRLPMEVKPGDRVLIGKYSGTEIRVGDDEFLICRQDDILAVFSELPGETRTRRTK